MSAMASPAPRCCARRHHFTALFGTRVLLKRRAPWTTAAELLVPLLLVCLMAVLYRQFDMVLHPAEAFATPTTPMESVLRPGSLTVLPLSVLPLRLARAGAALALVCGAPAACGARDAFLADMSALHPAFSAAGLGVGGPALAALAVPAFADVAVTFDSEAALEAHTRAPGYGGAAGRAVWGAIVFNAPLPDL